MAEENDPLYDESFIVEGERKSSTRILKAIREAQAAYRDYQDDCDRIDDVYSKRVDWNSDWIDPDYDLFWASTEILKTAIYAKPPVPVVSPMFSDRRPLYNTAAEMVERVAVSDFERSDLDQAMLGIRDDLIFTNRGVLWARYEDNEDHGQCVWGEHLDRKDFLHEPAREWAHVGWVARRAWMTKGELRKRFRKDSGDAYKDAKFEILAEERTNHTNDGIKKAGVWEVWHKADKKVYWVVEGCSVMLDHSDPYLDVKGFFPCPKPAYGTLARRSLIPIPDYRRYASILHQINKITARIYILLDQVKMRGLIPGGGDVGGAIKQLLESQDDSLLIEVPGAALLAGSSAGFVSWMPLAEIAETITGLIQARQQLFSDYDNLSGISDIMRGETQAEETLGAQRLKGQYGSVRVKGLISEIQRLARDFTRIVAEIAASKFTQDSLLEMSMMDLPTDADVKKQINGIEKAAKEELDALVKATREQAQQQPPQQQGMGMTPTPSEQGPRPDQQFQQAQQQIVAKYSQMLQEAENAVTIDAVMKLLRDTKARSMVYEVETDSTVMTDELAEKQSRNEFLQTVAGATAGLTQMAAMGPQGAALAGGLLKFVTAPYRVGRELNGLIDEFVESAPEMAAAMAGEGAGEDMAALAEAEMEKAKAQMAKVEADSKLKQAELQQRMAQMQIDTQEKQAKLQLDNQKLQLQASKQEQEFAAKMADMDAKQNLMQAQTAEILSKIGLDARKQNLEEYRAQTDTAFRAQDEARAAEGQQFDQAQAVEGNRRADRGEDRADRQQQFAEQQPRD
jgi:hypothetical protein